MDDSRHSASSSDSVELDPDNSPQVVNGVIDGDQYSDDDPDQQPFIEIVEQPQARGFRFRYECEGPSHGGLQGEKSERYRKSHPTIRIRHYSGQARVVVTLVTDESIPRSHAHKLVGRNCNDGICIVDVKAGIPNISFPNLCVQHITRRKASEVLQQRICESMELDKKVKMGDLNAKIVLTKEETSQAQSMAEKQAKDMQLNVVRLCFQAYLRDNSGSFTRLLPSVVSTPIYDSKSPGANALKICRMDKYGGCCTGNEEVFLLCEKVQKDDIAVRFVEQDDQGNTIWEEYGYFGPYDVHRQFAIVFKTPPYKDVNIEKPVNVLIMLQRKTDQEVSDPKSFTYYPKANDSEGVIRKRKKTIHYLNGNDYNMDRNGGAPFGGGGGSSNGGGGSKDTNSQNGMSGLPNFSEMGRSLPTIMTHQQPFIPDPRARNQFPIQTSPQQMRMGQQFATGQPRTKGQQMGFGLGQQVTMTQQLTAAQQLPPRPQMPAGPTMVATGRHVASAQPMMNRQPVNTGQQESLGQQNRMNFATGSPHHNLSQSFRTGHQSANDFSTAGSPYMNEGSPASDVTMAAGSPQSVYSASSPVGVVNGPSPTPVQMAPVNTSYQQMPASTIMTPVSMDMATVTQEHPQTLPSNLSEKVLQSVDVQEVLSQLSPNDVNTVHAALNELQLNQITDGHHGNMRMDTGPDPVANASSLEMDFPMLFPMTGQPVVVVGGEVNYDTPRYCNSPSNLLSRSSTGGMYLREVEAVGFDFVDGSGPSGAEAGLDEPDAALGVGLASDIMSATPELSSGPRKSETGVKIETEKEIKIKGGPETRQPDQTAVVTKEIGVQVEIPLLESDNGNEQGETTDLPDSTEAIMRTAMKTSQALQVYAASGDIRCLLMVQRFLMSVQDQNGDLPLHTSLINMRYEVFQNLLDVMVTLPDAYLRINAYNHHFQTPLHLAVLTNQPLAVDLLIRAGADPSLQDRNGNTAAHLAVKYGYNNCLSYLLKYLRAGANKQMPFPELNIRNYDGFSPSHLAAQLENLIAMKLLVHGLADVNMPDGKSGRTPLHHAVEADELSIAAFLILQAGATVNVKRFDGNTPLHIACGRGNVGMVALLMAGGADPNSENDDVDNQSDDSDHEHNVHVVDDEEHHPMDEDSEVEENVDEDEVDGPMSPSQETPGQTDGERESQRSIRGLTPAAFVDDNEKILKILRGEPYTSIVSIQQEADEKAYEETSMMMSSLNLGSKVESGLGSIGIISGDLEKIDYKTRVGLSKLLDQPDPGSDWLALAGKLGLRKVIEDQVEGHSPTRLLLTYFEECGGTVSRLNKALLDMHREDAINLLNEAQYTAPPSPGTEKVGHTDLGYDSGCSPDHYQKSVPSS